MKLRVIVCGGRTFSDRAFMWSELDQFPIGTLIHGGAPGADTLAGEYAKERNIPCVVFPANWTSEGPSAGPKRNSRMLHEGRADCVIAFPGRKGTANMMAQTKAAGVPLYLARRSC